MSPSTTARRAPAGGQRRGAEGTRGLPPEPNPIWARLESPMSTYYLLLVSIGLLLVIGLVMVLSASSVTSIRSRADNPYALFNRQAVFVVIGVVAAAVASRMPVAFWRRMAVPALVVAVVLQLLVFTPLGIDEKGNRNWLALGGLTMQPSELGKVALVLFGALVLSTKRRSLHRWRHAVIPLVVPGALVLVGLVLLGHDLGTALVLLAIVAGMMWAAGVSARLFALAGGAAGVLAVALVLVSGNRMRRIDQWLNCDDVQKCWQSQHGLFALADGGIGGQGPGAGTEKWGWLPEAHNDFIFAIIGEELGLGGTLTILVLFTLLALACYRVVMRSDDLFVRIATAGVMVWILTQAMINIGAVIGLLPVIGLPLPLVSYGGSALVTTLLALGMVVSFARNEPACRRALAARPRGLTRSLSVLAPRRSSRR